jgi:ribosomal protein S27E
MPTRQETQARCPECYMAIDHLHYEADYNEWGTEHGQANIEGGDWSCDDRDCSDCESGQNETTYRCPECDAEIDIDDLEDINEDEENDEDDENETENEITESNSEIITNRSAGTDNTTRNFNDINRKECPECHHQNLINGDYSEAIICETCNAEIL